jgi:hypothetical protein
MRGRLTASTIAARAAGGLLICCGVWAFAGRGTDERGLRTTRALDAYAAEKWDDAVALAAGDPFFAGLLKEFPATSAAWVKGGHDATAQSRRQREADVLALELANGSMRDSEERQAGRALVLHTASRVISGPVTPFDHAWAFALTTLLEGPPDRSPEWAEWNTRFQSRFPDDGRFALAAVTNRSEARLLTPHPVKIPDGVLSQAVTRTLADLSTLEARPDVRADAALRRGAIEFHTWNMPDALVDLAIAADPANGGDAFTRCLAHLVRGQALDMTSRHAEAIDEYDRAVEALPGAQSAQIARAVATMDTTRRLETAKAMDQVLTLTSPVPDPWHEYLHGEYRRWPDVIAALRALAAR